MTEESKVEKVQLTKWLLARTQNFFIPHLILLLLFIFVIAIAVEESVTAQKQWNKRLSYLYIEEVELHRSPLLIFNVADGPYNARRSIVPTDYCDCFKVLDGFSTSCRQFLMSGHLGLNFTDYVNDEFHALVAEGPADWRRGHKTVFNCSDLKWPEIQFFPVPMTFDEAITLYTERGESGFRDKFLTDFFSRPFTALKTHHFNLALLSRSQYFTEGRLEEDLINVATSRTKSGEDNATIIEVAWQGGFVTKTDHFTRGSAWDVMYHLCVMCLFLDDALAYFLDLMQMGKIRNGLVTVDGEVALETYDLTE